MIEFSLSKAVPVERVELIDPLNGFLSAVVWPSGRCVPPTRGAPAVLDIGDTKFNLVVDDFALSPAGGWIRIVAPAARAERYEAEVFSSAEGASFQQAIEARTKVKAPPELAKKHPAIVVDCTLSQLLDDVCFRNTGWVWWTGIDAIEIGIPEAAVKQCDGSVIAHTGGGVEVRLVEAAPRAGATVELPCGTKGVVRKATLTWQAGAVPSFSATLGALPAGARRAPRRSVRWPAKVVQLDPFVIELTDEERTGRGFRARGRLMMRRTDKNRFAEDIPIQAEDVLEAAVPTGGVSVLPVKVYAWSEAAPSPAYRVRTHTAEQTVAETLTTSAKEKSETFNKGETRVSERWNINKA